MERDRKKQIIESALKVFCEKGYESTTINDITKKAKCSHGLFYHYFKTKQEIYQAILEDEKKGLSKKLSLKLLKIDDYVEKLRFILEETFYKVKNDELFSQYFYFGITQIYHYKESGYLPPKINEDEEKKIPFIKTLINLFTEGQKKGYFTKKWSPIECATLLHNIIGGTMINYIVMPKKMQKYLTTPNVDLIINIFKAGE